MHSMDGSRRCAPKETHLTRRIPHPELDPSSQALVENPAESVRARRLAVPLSVLSRRPLRSVPRCAGPVSRRDPRRRRSDSRPPRRDAPVRKPSRFLAGGTRRWRAPGRAASADLGVASRWARCSTLVQTGSNPSRLSTLQFWGSPLPPRVRFFCRSRPFSQKRSRPSPIGPRPPLFGWER
jgi:hypothetical protein